MQVTDTPFAAVGDVLSRQTALIEDKAGLHAIVNDLIEVVTSVSEELSQIREDDSLVKRDGHMFIAIKELNRLLQRSQISLDDVAYRRLTL